MVLMTSVIEVGAVLAGIGYVWLAAREDRRCWILGVISSLLSIYLFYQGKLYAEAMLYTYYVAAGVYGWWSWQDARTGENSPIRTWTLREHLPAFVVTTALAWALGLSLAHYTDAQYPIVDAHTTLFSFLATWLTTRKVLSNWIYWVIIDAVSVGLYASRDLYLYALLMVAYTLMATYGYRRWQKRWQQENAVNVVGIVQEE